MKKSPGWENLGEVVSSLLPYVYTIKSAGRRVSKGNGMLTKICVEYYAKVFAGDQE